MRRGLHVVLITDEKGGDKYASRAATSLRRYGIEPTSIERIDPADNQPPATTFKPLNYLTQRPPPLNICIHQPVYLETHPAVRTHGTLKS